MRKNIITTLSMVPALLLALSCEKPVPDTAVSTEELIMTIDLGKEDTKSGNYLTEFASERAVLGVEYFIFDSDGRLEAKASGCGTSAVSVRVSQGTKAVWAAVNFPSSRFTDILTLSQFEAREVSFADFGTGRFPMSGKKTVAITGTGTASVSIPVERFVSRICIAEVRNSLAGSLSGKEMVLRYSFLSNVPGNSKVNGDSPSSRLWYNRFGRRDGAGQNAVIASSSDASYPSLTFADHDESWITSNNYEAPYACMYFFPNPTTSDVTGWSSAFSPRYTRIVNVIEIDGDTYYYPVNIVGARRNHAYTLYLTVTHFGTKDPDSLDFVTAQDVTITIGGFDDFDDSLEITY